MKPSTPLPWFNCSISWVQPGDKDSINSPQGNMRGDSEYALHAANAYPRLIELLRSSYSEIDGMDRGDMTRCEENILIRTRTILRELGELK